MEPVKIIVVFQGEQTETKLDFSPEGRGKLKMLMAAGLKLPAEVEEALSGPPLPADNPEGCFV